MSGPYVLQDNITHRCYRRPDAEEEHGHWGVMADATRYENKADATRAISGLSISRHDRARIQIRAAPKTKPAPSLNLFQEAAP